MKRQNSQSSFRLSLASKNGGEPILAADESSKASFKTPRVRNQIDGNGASSEKFIRSNAVPSVQYNSES